MRRVLLSLALPAMAVAFSSSVPLGSFAPQRSAIVASPASHARLALRGPSAARIGGGRGALAASMSSIQKIADSSSEVAGLEKQLENTAFWSILPSQTTMYLDDPEVFHLVKGRVAVFPCEITGIPTGAAIEFNEGDYGVIPAGAHRWDIQKPTTKQSNVRAGLQMTTKGWLEEPPFSAMRGKGTLSTKGRDSEDDLKYMKELIAAKGVPPPHAWEDAINLKLDADPYLANLGFIVTDKGIVVRDRVSEKPLEVLGPDGWLKYDEDGVYVETEGSKRWRKDGNFQKSKFFQNEDKL